MTKLRKIHLYDSFLTGTLPVLLPPYLNSLRLENNYLNGTLPSEVGDLTDLEHIFFNHNDFSGTLPHHWSQLRNALVLYLDTNQLTGTLPDVYGNLISLEYLSFAENKIHALEYLDLTDNHFSQHR